MPGFDGTGPRGQGSMTGGGFGRCPGAGYGMRPRFGRGGGFGRGWGMGQGRFAWGGYGAPMQPMDATTNGAAIDDRIAALSQELEQLKKQRENLD
ncbi:DUF5320 domain-containing protein [Desulfoplanes sp.]